MDAQEPAQEPFSKFIRQGKITGWWFLVIGSILCLSTVPPVFSPHATVMVDGVPTDDFATKLWVAVFAGSFPVVGAFLAFIPKRTMQRGLVAVSRFMHAGV